MNKGLLAMIKRMFGASPKAMTLKPWDGITKGLVPYGENFTMANGPFQQLARKGVPNYLPVPYRKPLTASAGKAGFGKKAGDFFFGKGPQKVFGEGGKLGLNGKMLRNTAKGSLIGLPLLMAAYASSRDKNSNFDPRQVTPQMDAETRARIGQPNLDLRSILAMAGATLPLAWGIRGFRGKGLLGASNNALRGTAVAAGAGALGMTASNVMNNASYQREIAQRIRERNMRNPFSRGGY